MRLRRVCVCLGIIQFCPDYTQSMLYLFVVASGVTHFDFDRSCVAHHPRPALVAAAVAHTPPFKSSHSPVLEIIAVLAWSQR